MDSGEERSQEKLWEAYRGTSFEARVGDGKPDIKIRIDKICPALDGLLQEKSLARWIYVTAWNPGLERPGKLINEQRNRALLKDLNLPGRYVFSGVGRGEDLEWEPEESFLALGVELDVGIRLGQKYGQAAIVAGELGGPACLIDCRRSA